MIQRLTAAESRLCAQQRARPPILLNRQPASRLILPMRTGRKTPIEHRFGDLPRR